MTSRERFLNSIRGIPVDRFFRYEHGAWPSTLARWYKEGLPPEVGRTVEFAEYFGMDPVNRIAINSGYTNSPYEPAFDKRIIEESGDTVLFMDRDGIVKREKKKARDTSMPQFVRFPVRIREDWEAVKNRLKPGDASSRIGDPAHLEERQADNVPSILPICGVYGQPRNLLGEEGLAYVLYDDPHLLEDIVRNWLALYTALIEELTSRVRVDSLLIWEDMCYRNGPLISPEHFTAFMLPAYGQLIGAAQACGIEAIIVDSDGDVMKMIPQFLAAGANCLMPFEVQAGMDVVRIRRRFGCSFSIMGGIDKRALAEGKRAIEMEVERVLPHFLNGGRFLPTLDHTVPTDVPLENFRHYLKVVRRYEAT